MLALLCVQLASYLEGGPLMWMMHLHIDKKKKSYYDDDMRSHCGVVDKPLAL